MPALSSLKIQRLASAAAAAALAPGLAAAAGSSLHALSIGGACARGVERLADGLAAAVPGAATANAEPRNSNSEGTMRGGGGCGSLRHLDLQSPDIDAAAAAALWRALTAHPLERLSLVAPREVPQTPGAASGGGGAPQAAAAAVSPIAALLAAPPGQHPYPREVSISRAALPPAALTALGAALAGGAALRLEDCSIGDAGAKLLMRAAAERQCGGGGGGGGGGAAALSFERCGLGPAGAAAAAAAAAGCPGLAEVALSGDDVSAGGLEAVAGTLAGRGALRELAVARAGVDGARQGGDCAAVAP
jgi:hypothetical protein